MGNIGKVLGAFTCERAPRSAGHTGIIPPGEAAHMQLVDDEIMAVAWSRGTVQEIDGLPW